MKCYFDRDCIILKKKIGKIGMLSIVMVLMFSVSINLQAQEDTVPRVSITNAEKQLTMEKGEKKKLKTESSVKRKIQWKSSNESVVTVSKGGKLKAKKPGYSKVSAVIIYKGQKFLDQVKVTVGKKVTRIKCIDFPKKKQIMVGKTVKFRVKAFPQAASNKRIIWLSSDKTIATVNSKGVVKAKTNGTVKITAMAADGSGKKKTSVITVYTLANKVKIIGDTIVGVNRTIQLKKVVEPVTTTKTEVVWSSSNPDVAVVDSNGCVTGKSVGTANISICTKDGSNITGGMQINVVRLSHDSMKFLSHRGMAKIAPENTIAAFSLAAQKPFYGIETDIYESNGDGDHDGHRDLMIMHDLNLNRMCHKNILTVELTKGNRQQFPIIGGVNTNSYPVQYAPSLEEYLAVIKDKVPAIEIKQYTFSKESVEEVLRILRLNNIKKADITSSYWDPLEKFAQQMSDEEKEKYSLNFTVYDTKPNFPLIQKSVEKSKEVGVRTVQVPKEMASQMVVNYIHDNDLEAGVWIVDSLSEGIKYDNMGFDCITTNIDLFTD